MDTVQPAHLVNIDTVTVATNAFGVVLVQLGIVRPVRTKYTKNKSYKKVISLADVPNLLVMFQVTARNPTLILKRLVACMATKALADTPRQIEARF